MYYTKNDENYRGIDCDPLITPGCVIKNVLTLNKTKNTGQYS